MAIVQWGRGIEGGSACHLLLCSSKNTSYWSVEKVRELLDIRLVMRMISVVDYVVRNGEVVCTHCWETSAGHVGWLDPDQYHVKNTPND